MHRCIMFFFVASVSLPALAADVAVSITMGEPGFYGRIDIGDTPHPELIYRQPTIIKPVVGVVRAPIYLHVPPGHFKDWTKHCGKYKACGERVFFVHDRWYNEIYVPAYRKRHGKSNHARGSENGQGTHKD